MVRMRLLRQAMSGVRVLVGVVLIRLLLRVVLRVHFAWRRAGGGGEERLVVCFGRRRFKLGRRGGVGGGRGGWVRGGPGLR